MSASRTLVLLLALAAPGAWAFDESLFPIGSLAAFEASEEMRQARGEKKADVFFDLRARALTVFLSYTGKERPLSDDRKLFLKRVGQAFRMPPAWAEQYQKEILAREKGKDFWIPVQEQFAGFLPRELKPGKPLKAWVRFLGLDRGKPIWIMVGYEAREP